MVSFKPDSTNKMIRIAGPALLTVMLASCGSHPSSTHSALEVMLKEDAAYSERLLNAEADSPDANLKEFDDFCDRSVELRTERLIKIQALLADSQADLKKTIIDHFNAENSLVRAKRRFYDSFFELKSLRARKADLKRKADASAAMEKKYEVTDDDVENSLERLETKLQFAEQTLSYMGEGIRLTSTVNAAAVKALDAGKSYTESLERALVTEKRLGDALGTLGVKIGTPINASAKDVIARASATLQEIQGQRIK